jgi:hypothetical protein
MEKLAILDFVLLKNLKLLHVLYLGLEKLGLELDNHGPTTKNDHRHIYDFWLVFGQQVCHYPAVRYA